MSQHKMDHGSDFMFGFNNIRFSDRELIIEVLPDELIHPQSGVEALHADDDATHRPGGLQTAESGESLVKPLLSAFCNWFLVAFSCFAGVETSHTTDSSCSQQCSRVTKLHVNSLILAAKSQFFHNLFTNGMMESEQRSVTMKIHANEEAAFMEILKYMYSGSLTAQTAPALLDVFKLADKFQVVSCMKLCTSLLIKLPMSSESALLYLDLTSSLPMADEVQLLANAAKEFLVAKHKDIDKFWDEIMELPLAGVEAILSSEELQVSSEDKIFDFALKWTETHYPKPEDQRKILSAHLGPCIRFHYMSLKELKAVLSCRVFDHDFAYEAVVKALFFKLTAPYHHRTQTTAEYIERCLCANNSRRNYSIWPVKAFEFEFPYPELVVYFDLMFDECANLEPSQVLYSESLEFEGYPCCLYAQCSSGQEGDLCFSVGLRLDLDPWEDEDEDLDRMSRALDFEISARSSDDGRFVLVNDGLPNVAGKTDLILYEVPWLEFKAGGCLDSIDGIIYLEIKLRLEE